MNLVLCGMPRSGKSTLGKALAMALGWVFIDSDGLMEDCFKSSIKQLYQSHGEELFREKEYQILQTLVGIKNSVIATGGGCVSHLGSRAILKTLGKTIYLKVSVNTLLARMLQTHVTSMLDSENLEISLEKMLAKRGPLYEEIAEHIINADTTSENEAVQYIHTLIKR